MTAMDAFAGVCFVISLRIAYQLGRVTEQDHAATRAAWLAESRAAWDAAAQAARQQRAAENAANGVINLNERRGHA